MRIKGKPICIGDLVWIKWEDHWSNQKGGWTSLEKVHLDPMLCETVGWVIGMKNGRIATTQTHDGQQDPYIHGHYMVCPIRMIMDIKVLKKKGKIWNG